MKKRYRIVIEAELFGEEIIGFKEQLAEIRDVKVIDVKEVVRSGKEK